MKRSFIHGQEIAIRQESDTVRQESDKRAPWRKFAMRGYNSILHKG